MALQPFHIAVARALITNGVVTRIDVLYPGSNYITQPVITIDGSCTTPATAYAILKNNKIRNIKTTLTYDRITYSTTVIEWTPNTAYTAGSIITYKNVAYIVNSNFTSGATFNGNYLTVYKADNFATANNWFESLYNPTVVIYTWGLFIKSSYNTVPVDPEMKLGFSE